MPAKLTMKMQERNVQKSVTVWDDVVAEVGNWWRKANQCYYIASGVGRGTSIKAPRVAVKLPLSQLAAERTVWDKQP